MCPDPIVTADDLLDEGGSATSTKRTKASLRASERELRARIASLEAKTLRYETAIDNIPQGICVFDHDQRLILCNRRYAEIYRSGRSRSVRVLHSVRS